MADSPDTDSRRLWEELVLHDTALDSTLMKFLAADVDRVKVLQTALKQGEIHTALYVAQYMRESELMQLFPDWVDLASNDHRHLEAARAIIQALPRNWVVANIEAVAEPLLQHGTEDEFRRLLELYRQLSLELTLRLARRAAGHADWEIREAGEEYLEKLPSSE